MKTNQKIALLVAALAFMVGCGPDLASGTVTEKDYSSEYTIFTQNCIPQANGAPSICYQTPITTPECYEIVYSDGEHTDSVCVDPVTYESINIGDYFAKD